MKLLEHLWISCCAHQGTRHRNPSAKAAAQVMGASDVVWWTVTAGEGTAPSRVEGLSEGGGRQAWGVVGPTDQAGDCSEGSAEGLV